MILELLFISLAAFAETATEAIGACATCELEAKKNHVYNLEWWAATASQVSNAPCTRDHAFTPKEMEDHLALLDKNPLKKEDQSLNGIEFKNESPELLQLFKGIHEQKKYGNGPLVLGNKVKCDKVICAMSSIYGKPVGTQLLFMMSKYGFNGSRLGNRWHDNYSPWNQEELNHVLLALESMPPSMHPMDVGRPLLHFKRGYVYAKDNDPKTETVANSYIEVFDAWNRRSRTERRQALVHELGHVIAYEKNLDLSPEWLKTTGWVVKPGANPKNLRDRDNYIAPRQGLPSRYGGSSPAEDFAESVVAYRFNAGRFKKENPERYAFIKEKVFDGREFINFRNCNPEYVEYSTQQKEKALRHAKIRSQEKKLRETVSKVLSVFLAQKPKVVTLTEAQNKLIMKKCLNTYFSDIASGDKRTSEKCIDTAIKATVFGEFMSKTGVKIDSDSLTEEMLEPFALNDTARLHFLRYMVPILNESFNEAYENTETVLRLASEAEECDLFAKYYKEDLPKNLAPYISKEKNGELNSDVEKIVARACKIGLKDFGSTIIPRSYNIFAKNPFEKIFR